LRGKINQCQLQVTFFYLDHTHEIEYQVVADTLKAVFKKYGVTVMASKSWTNIYHHGYSPNPFDQMVEDTFQDTRSE
jgi:hypothetical protein